MTAHAESKAAYTDIELSLESSVSTVDPASPVQVTLTVYNDGNFGTGSATISVPVPDGLSLAGFVAESGSYDAVSEQWISSEISSYESSTLVFDYVANSEGPSEIVVVAELVAFDSEYGSYDPDSTPDNGDVCEDDYASLRLAVNGRPLLDAGVPEPDCGGPVNPRADAGAQAGTDAGAQAGIDAGPEDMTGGNSGCSSSGSGGNSILALLALALLFRRRTRIAG